MQENLENIAKEENITGEDEGPVNLETVNGNKYIVYKEYILFSDSDIKIENSEINLSKGENKKIEANLVRMTGQIEYESENENVVTVDAQGNITGVGQGKTNIKLSCNGITKTCSINVSRLPAEYQEVEYLESWVPGNWNENGYIPIPYETRCYAYVKFKRIYNYGDAIFLAGGGVGHYTEGLYTYNGRGSVAGVSINLNNIYEYWDISWTQFKINGEKKTHSNGYAIPQPDDSKISQLFRYENNRKLILYRAVEFLGDWENSPTILHDFIPCYRKLDNKTGVYDIISNTFYSNATSDEFITGPNV